MKDGNIFLGGGSRVLEIYNPHSSAFSVAAELNDPYYYSSATLLNDGSVLITGGYNDRIEVSNKGWLYKALQYICSRL